MGVRKVKDRDDQYFHGYNEIEEAFRFLTEDDILRLYISDNVFRSSSTVSGGKEIGYILYAFNLHYKKNSQGID